MKDIASRIDHTILRASAKPEEIVKLCAEAREYGFASVCINPCFVALAAEELKDSDVMVCTVVGFPLGANAPEIKMAETEFAVAQGADEIDMVINVGQLKAGNIEYVRREIAGVVDAAASKTVKVIIEACYLTDEEKALVSEACVEAGAHFVKTSTGFGTGGATVEDIALMRRVVGDRAQLKAAGGIRSYADAAAMVAAGADRIGASAGIAIVEQSKQEA